MQPSLFDYVPSSILHDRDGETYDRERDHKRLDTQAADVFRLMQDSRWRMLAEIAAATMHPEASISARLRDFRKAGYTVERKHVGNGLWAYRVTRP